MLSSPGAQIIDLMILVVDVVKGMQTQTAECLLIGELTCPRMVVVLNKIDLLPASKRQSAVEKMTKRMHKTLESTRFVFILHVGFEMWALAEPSSRDRGSLLVFLRASTPMSDEITPTRLCFLWADLRNVQ